MNTQTAETKVINYENDPRLSKQVREFLKGLNGAGGPPIENLLPIEARKVLSDAQASVKVDLSGIEVVEKTINADGYTIKLNIVRPEGEKGILPVFMFIHGGGWVLGDFSHTQKNGKGSRRAVGCCRSICQLHTNP